MISGVILARNEENNIVECIKSIRPHVAELILIDMDSADDTVSLAQSFVDKVMHHELVANFDPVRNIAIPESNNDWLWFIDADERVSDQTAAAVKQLVGTQGDSFEAINIPFKTYFCGKWIEHSGWWPGYTMPRVLKKGFFKFSERLHGGVELEGMEIRLPPDPELAVDHFSYLSIEHYLEKLNRYTSTEANQLFEANQSIDWRNGIAHMIHDLWMYYERNSGNLDGRHGWILAWLSGQYRWLSHAKLLDKNTKAIEHNAQLAPESLTALFDVMSQELERNRGAVLSKPRGLVWRSPIWDPSGYADEGRCFAKALSQLNRHVSIESINWNEKRCELPNGDKALFSAMARSKRAETNVAITNCIPTLVEPDRAAAFNVIRTTFETDRIPESWLPRLSAFDEVWVISKQNERSFRQAGVAPEKMRRVPSFVDTDLYKPDGDRYPLPQEFRERFVFLSVFEWQYRKGWDVLLRAFTKSFETSDRVSLLLKISKMHGQSLDQIIAQANEVLGDDCPKIEDRIDIGILDEFLSAEQMASLYRACDAFVLPSRGEGWGRPYMEAMACGLPTIGTNASGNVDFMSPNNSILVDAQLETVPEEAVMEIPPYDGHKWWEPDEEKLVNAMQDIWNDDSKRVDLAKAASIHIHENFGIEAGKESLERSLQELELRFPGSHKKDVRENQIQVTLEGELFANHSFSNINEQLAEMFIDDDIFALSIDRKIHNPTSERDNIRYGKLASAIATHEGADSEITIRHAFPPNFAPVRSGAWIHIQPWEFGHLPAEWIKTLKEDVDEIWAPTNYVKDVYVNSGISPEKVIVIPWGIDTKVFNDQVPPRFLPSNKAFKFLFVGGTIERKGFDRLFEAYTKEFSKNDNVSLVIKDLGTQTFYRYGNYQERIRQVQQKRSAPEIVYFDESWTAGQLASLYKACDCLVMPYRGEGFGLPILESMACGTPAIVPTNGASDDFVDESTGIQVDGIQIESSHEWELTGPALELDLSVDELREKMRWAVDNKERTSQLGRTAAKEVRANWTWEKSFELMKQRLSYWAGKKGPTTILM